MADALVGIGADLSALTSSLQQIPRIAGTEADKAIRKVQQMSIRASRGVSKAIRQQARENQRAQQAAERAARRSAAANEQVRQVMLAAERETMTASQRAASALQEELRALDRLAAKGAEVAQVERARAAAVAAGARKIAAARAQGAAKSSSELARAGQSVAMQIPDVITQLSMGTPVLIVLAQQGLQVVQQNMGLVMKAGKALAGLLSGPVAIAAGVVVAAFSVVANHLDETRHRMAAFEEAVNSTAKALSTSQLKSYAQAQRDIAEAVDDANLVLAQELGIVDSLDIAQMRAVESIKEAARATTLEAAAIYAKLQVQRQELMQRLHSGELDRYEEGAAKRRIRQLDEQLPRAKAVIDAIKDDVEARQMQVFETYEQIEAIRLEREAQREAEKATRRGSKAIEEQAAAAEKRAAALAKLGAALQAIEEQQTRAFESALAAAQEPFIDKSEIAVLGRLRDGLVEAASAARLTGDEALRTQAALAQIDARIEQIKASSAAALDPLTRQLEQVGGARANGRRSRDGIRRSADGADLGHVDRRHRTRGGRKSRRRALNSHRRRARGGRQSCRYDWAIA
jgi:sugar-specific transcriptional regulator TrmB